MIFHPDADDCSQVRQGRQYAGPRLVLVLVTLAAGGHTPPSLAQPRQQLPGAVAGLVLSSLVVARLRRVLLCSPWCYYHVLTLVLVSQLHNTTGTPQTSGARP